MAHVGVILSTLSAVVIGAISLGRFVTHRRASQFPGPRGLPLVGNALQIPSHRQWLTFDAWTKQYGDIFSLNILGQPTLVLGTAQTAIDLLETRGAIYSDRPPAVMAGELVGWSRGLGYSNGPPNPRFREFRRIFHKSIGPRACAEDDLIQTIEDENRKFIRNLAIKSDKFFDCARDSTGSLILRLAYGYKVTREHDPFVKIAEDAMAGFSKASEPGWMVDSLPFLRFLPEWCPGAGFKATAKTMRQDLERLYEVPFRYVKDQLASSAAPHSFTADFLHEKGGNPLPADEEFVKAAAASLYSGGAETTPSSVTSFILAMALYPEVQSRAQRELDTVLGAGDTSDMRLPRASDIARLPYINAIVKEVLRWNPSVPLGLPHVAASDDIYRDRVIRKGTVIWANIWSLLHDEKIYSDPFEFRPERFLNEEGELRPLRRNEDPSEIAFGYGRRICPGLHLAEISVFLSIASILYAFTISKKKDAQSVEIIPIISYRGFISHPDKFECCIEPTSQSKRQLILNI